MKSDSDSTQILAMGVAFCALVFGAILSLDTTTAAVLSHSEDDNTKSVAKTPAKSLSNTKQSPEIHIAAMRSAVSSLGKSQEEEQPKEEVAQSLDGQRPKEVHKDAQERAQRSKTDNPVMTKTDKREILWLARIMYSETKRADEQRLIGWVVRNRVDTGYYGQSYESVAQSSGQFSGLQPYDRRYEHNMSRYRSSSGASWENALATAREVYFADESERPFALTVRHFYSPNAVSRTPAWAQGREAIEMIKDPHTDRVRFALYDKVR